MKKILTLVVLALSATLVSCGGGGGGGSTSSNTMNSNIINIVAAPVSLATCKAYKIESGVKGDLIGESPLSDSGKTTFSDFAHTGKTLIECTGGTYIDEAANTETSLTVLSSVVNMTSSGSYSLTPLTHMATQTGIKNGDLDEVLTKHNQNIADQFGLEGLDITTLVPSIAASGTDEVSNDYGLAVAAVSQLGTDEGKSLQEITTDIVDDMSGGEALSSGIQTKLKTAIDNIASNSRFDFSGADSSTIKTKVGTDTANDTIKPKIILTGSKTVSVTYGDGYTDDGSTVVDNSGETISAVLSGSVDSTTQVGSHKVTYKATDSSGNQESVVRTVVVTPKTATATANPKSKTYGDVDPALTYSISGLVGSDTLSGSLAREAGDNVGTYTINQGSLSGGTNYNLLFESGNFTITKKDINVVAQATGTRYGDVDPALTYSISGLVGSDTLSGSLAREAGDNVGTYTINQGSLSGGTNYNIANFTSANFSVNARAITVTADDVSKTEGNSDPVFTYSFSPALVGLDVFTGSLSRASGEDIGSYAISQGSLKLNSNYSITFNSANLSISNSDGKAAQNLDYGSDTVLKRDASPFTRSVSGDDAQTGLAYNSSNEDVATVGVSSGEIVITGVGSATIEVSSNGGQNHKAATASFTLTVDQTILQILRGGFYHNADPDIGMSSAYNTTTGTIEEVNTLCSGTSNSSEINHYFIDTDGDGVRCSKGVIFGKKGSLELDGLAEFIIDTTTNAGVDIIYFKGFASEPDNPAGGFTGMDIPALSNVTIGTTQTVSVDGNFYTAERQIYDDGINPAGTYEFVAGDFHVENDPNISVGDTVTGCEDHGFFRTNGNISEDFTTIICKKKGSVKHVSGLN